MVQTKWYWHFWSVEFHNTEFFSERFEQNSYAPGAAQAQKVSGCKDPKISQKWPLNSNFCFLLHFYTTIFKSQWVHLHPLHPQLRGPWATFNVKSLENYIFPIQDFFFLFYIGTFEPLDNHWWILNKIRWVCFLTF